jgi:hypothetical protein
VTTAYMQPRDKRGRFVRAQRDVWKRKDRYKLIDAWRQRHGHLGSIDLWTAIRDLNAMPSREFTAFVTWIALR